MLILNRSQVEALLDVDALIDALASAMADLSAGRASVPDRVAALVPGHEGFLAAMPGFVPSAKVLMSKLVSLFPHNAGAGLPTHQAVIVAFDPDTANSTSQASAGPSAVPARIALLCRDICVPCRTLPYRSAVPFLLAPP